MSWNNVIPIELIEGGVHSTAPIEEVPEIVLSHWIVFEVSSLSGIDGLKDHHFVGWNVAEGEGRVSSKIVYWDDKTRIAKTKSGRTYQLQGDSGMNMDALYVWDTWMRINKIEDYKDVSELYEKNTTILPEESW